MATRSLALKGGDKLNKYLATLGDRLGRGAVVRVGFLEGATYPEGKRKQVRKRQADKSLKVVGRRIVKPKAGQELKLSVPLAVAQVAFWNEFGRKGQPARPFFRNAIAKHQDEWGDVLAAFAKATNFDGAKMLGGLGEVMQGEIRESIIDLVSPKLSQKTIDAKGFAKPLIDTSTMLRSVDYEVSKVPAA